MPAVVQGLLSAVVWQKVPSGHGSCVPAPSGQNAPYSVQKSHGTSLSAEYKARLWKVPAAQGKHSFVLLLQ